MEECDSFGPFCTDFKHMALFIEACWKRGAVCISPADVQSVFLVHEGAAFTGLLIANSSINPQPTQMQTADPINVFIKTFAYLLFSFFAFLSIYLAIYLRYLYTVSIYLTMLCVSV